MSRTALAELEDILREDFGLGYRACITKDWGLNAVFVTPGWGGDWDVDPAKVVRVLELLTEVVQEAKEIHQESVAQRCSYYCSNCDEE